MVNLGRNEMGIGLNSKLILPMSMPLFHLLVFTTTTNSGSGSSNSTQHTECVSLEKLTLLLLCCLSNVPQDRRFGRLRWPWRREILLFRWLQQSKKTLFMVYRAT